MIHATEQIKPISDIITVTIYLVSGDMLTQSFLIEEADNVQMFIDWYHKPGRQKTFSFHHIASQTVRVIHHDKITMVDIDGYIEPEGRSSRWYERLIDSIRIRWIRRG